MPDPKNVVLVASLALAHLATAQGELSAQDGPQGGHILSEEVGGASSAATVLQTGLRRLRGPLEEGRLMDGVRSKDGRTLIAPFRARWRGTPVAGLIVAAYDPYGHSRLSALFDDPKRLPQTLRPMMAALNGLTREAMERHRPKGGGTGGPDYNAYAAAARRVSLSRTAFPDGTASIGVAPSFTATLMQQGTFNGGAPDGAYLNVYMAGGFLDPNGSVVQQEKRMNGGQIPNIPGQMVLDYDPNPLNAWKRRLETLIAQRGGESPDIQVQHDTASGNRHVVSGTMTLNGEPFVFSGVLLGLGRPPSAEGYWNISITMLAAPAAHADKDMPALIAMRDSERVDLERVRQTVMENIRASQSAFAAWSRASHEGAMDSMRRTFESSMRNAATVQESIDRSAAGMIHYVQGAAVLEHLSSGRAGVTDGGAAEAIAHEDPEHFRVVPVSEYVKGRDF